MELLDVYDEVNNYSGYAKDRDFVHKNNLWHRHVPCFIMNEKGEVLLQQRSLTKAKNPGVWSKTGGHVDAGETPSVAIRREVMEEIGLELSDEDIINIEIFKSVDPKEHYFTYGYIFYTTLSESDFKLQKEEVNDVKYYTIEELEEEKQNNNPMFAFSKWTLESFKYQMELLKEYRDKILKKELII